MMIPRLLIPVMVVAVALVGVLLGLWKIDTLGLGCLAIGSFFVFGHGYWKFFGFGLIIIGIALWLDWINLSIGGF